MFYNHEQAVIDFFQSYHPNFEYFLIMVHDLLPTDITNYGRNGHFSTYEVKLLVCGLSKALFRKDWVILPFKTEEEYESELRDSAIRISNTLYWLKLQEDHRIYFNNQIMLKRAEKIERQLTLAKQRSKPVEDEVLKFDNQDE